MWLLLDMNRNSYMESPTAPLDLTLSKVERSKSRSPRIQSLISLYISRTGAKLSPMLLLIIKRETIYGEYNDTITFELG